MPHVEFKRKARLSRQEVAERLIALGNALAEGSEIELSSGCDTLRIGVASRVAWELEIEIDREETELEIELKWTDDPKSNTERAAAPDAADPATEPAEHDSDPKSSLDKPAPARRGRPHRTAAP